MQIRNELHTLGNLTEILKKALTRVGVPGMSVAIYHKGEIVYAEGFGKRNAKGDPFTPETLMPIASVTKAFTATAIGEMVAEGKLDWDTTSVSKYLPEFELKDPLLTSQLTFADLLSHRTGLPSIDMIWFRATESRRDLIKRLRYLDVSSKLKATNLYNNGMYAVAGEAASNVAGVPYEELVTTKVLKPLGLHNSGFSPKEMRKNPNHAMPFRAQSWEEAQRGEFVEGYLDEIYMADAPAGDMYSNVLDLLRWGRTIMNYGMIDGKQVLNKKSIEETLTPHSIFGGQTRDPEFAPALLYGLGWMLDSYKGQVLYRHSGSIPGFGIHLAMFPHADLVIAQFVNIDGTQLPLFTTFLIADELLDLPRSQDWIFDKAIEDTKHSYERKTEEEEGQLPPPLKNRPCIRDLKEFVGEYSSDAYGNMSVRIEKVKVGETGEMEDRLYFKMRTFDSRAEHYHFDTFRVFLTDFAVRFRVLLSFEAGADGKVKSAQLAGSDPGMNFFFKKESVDAIIEDRKDDDNEL